MKSIQLNANHRAAFVRGVMGELPELSLLTTSVKIQNIVLEEAKKSLPVPVAKLLEDPQLRNHVTHSWRYVGHTKEKVRQEMRSMDFNVETGVRVPLPEPESRAEDRNSKLYAFMSKAARAEIDNLLEEAFNQHKSRKEVEAKLRITIAGFKTLKQALAGLPPELHKYLPQEKTLTAGVPAMASVLPDLKKLGWPAPAKQAA